MVFPKIYPMHLKIVFVPRVTCRSNALGQEPAMGVGVLRAQLSARVVPVHRAGSPSLFYFSRVSKCQILIFDVEIIRSILLCEIPSAGVGG